MELSEKPRAYIEKIVVEGFKSYGPKRREIPLGEGFIAVVGPNGSGKSNIGDAISFALGLASSKVLRAKNLSYLIWNKGNRRADYAYVEVHFKNQGAFPLEEDTVVISRKVFPEGRSVFKINGKTVKERDVKELLSRAGITENAYNVVLQGDIIHFLKMTPLQRRRLIEEIAGIGEFEEKKKKALEELGAVELKLSELKLVIDELSERLSRLERDRNDLLLYRRLKAEKENLERKLLLKELWSVLKNEEKLQKELQKIQSQIETLSEEEKRLKELLEELETKRTETEKLLAPYREKIGKLRSEEEFISNQIKRLEEEIEKSLGEERKLLAEKEGLEGKLAELTEKRKLLEKKLKELSEREKAPREELKKLDEKIASVEGEIESSLRRLEETERELKELEREKENLEARLKGLLRELDGLDAKVEATERNLEELEEQKRELLASFVGNVELEVEKLQKLVEQKKREKERLEKRLTELDEKIGSLSSLREEKLRELLRLEAQSGGETDGLVEYLKRSVEGVYGTVAELVRVREEEYITAVEIAGGNRLRYVVVEDENVAKRCIELLKRENLGRLTFIPLNRIRPPRVDFLPRTRGVIDYVYRLVDYDPKFEKAILYVFGDTVLVEDYESAKRLGIGLYRMVTLSGELFERGGTITGGHYKPSDLLRRGFYEAKKEELRLELERIEKKLEKLKNEYEKTKERLWEAEGTVNHAIRKLKELESSRSAAVEKLKKIEEKITKGREYLEYLRKQIEEKEKLVYKLQEEIENLQERIKTLKSLREKLVEKVSRSGLEPLKAQRQKVLEILKELEEERKTLEKELSDLEREEEKLRLRLENIKENLLKANKEREEKLSEIERLKTRLKEVRKGFSEAGEKVKKLVELLNEFKTEREKLERELTFIEAKMENLRSEREKLLLRLETLKERRKNLENSLGGVSGEFPPEPVEELKKQLTEVERRLKNLGNVNFRAEEEYREVKEKFDDYKARYSTLLKEKKAVKELISELERKKERIFLKTFREVNRHFKEIFAFLSPGGKAYMELEKPHDIFAGGIQLMVKPRGKEVKFLEAMSGGEKTLAALALIFALQRHKPAPFYYFDEVDAHLDETNAVRVGELIKKYSKEAQFIVVTLRESVAHLADRLIGVTSRGGISEVYFVDPKVFKKEQREKITV